MELLMKKKQKITLKKNGQAILTVPTDIVGYITTENSVIISYEKQDNKIIITLEQTL